MISFATASNHALVSPGSCLTHFRAALSPSCPFFAASRNGAGGRGACLVAKETDTGCEFSWDFEVKNKGFSRKDHWFSCWCTRGWDCEGDLALEAKILEFMRTSEKPEAFPSKKELWNAGRMDLVEAIQRQGGWLALGWDSDGEDDSVQASRFKDSDFTTVEKKCDDPAFHERIQNDVGSSWSSSFDVDSSCPASSSGRDVAANNESGIEGILSRLEKERRVKFDMRGKGVGATARNDINNVSPSRTSLCVTVAGLRKSRPASSVENRRKNDDIRSKVNHNFTLSGINKSRNSFKPKIWGNWSIQRDGLSDMEFQGRLSTSSGARETDEIIEVRDISSELCRSNKSNSSNKELDHNTIRTCLEHLELELSSVLNSVRSNAAEVSSQVDGSSNDDMQMLSDTWEFRENEVMNAQDKLRSIRAKLAVLEGKMALAVIDAQKMVGKKKKRIDATRRDLQLLRTASIVWPNSASEVLLAGSFDGWATQRKMKKSRFGVFSLYLKLYPGRYEIKFIVDGKWKIDPLRPIVYDNGYENNLLIIT